MRFSLQPASAIAAERLRLGAKRHHALSDVTSDVDLVFCDLPHVPPGAMGRFLLTQMASVAELEAGLISERTKAALAAAKARGACCGFDLAPNLVRAQCQRGVLHTFADGDPCQSSFASR
jgi:resolvase-like protein